MFVAFVRRFVCSAALALSCASQGMAAGVTPGSVAGLVVDGEGRAVAGARVVLDGPEHLASVTAWNGRFRVAAVAPGRYRAMVTPPSAAGPALLDVVVRSAETSAIAVTLPPPAGMTTSPDEAGLATIAGIALDPADLADAGSTRVSDALQDDDTTVVVSATAGGSPQIPAPAAGPGGTWPANGGVNSSESEADEALSPSGPFAAGANEVLRGITPASLAWPGSGVVPPGTSTLEPTAAQHGLLRLNLGTFSALGATLQTTGTLDSRVGYALSLHRQDSAGEVNEPIYNLSTGTGATVGSGSSGSSALAKLRYAFGTGDAGYAEVSFVDQGAQRDLSAALSAYPAAGRQPSVLPPVTTLPQVFAYPDTALQAHVAGYGVDALVPLGGSGSAANAPASLALRYSGSLLDQSVSGPGAEISPYLFNDRYAVNDGSLEFERRLGSATLGLQYEVREEALTTDFVSPPAVATPGPVPVPAPLPVPGRPAHGRVPATPAEPLLLGETARTLSLRYSFLPVPSLRLGAAAEYSALSPFGAQLDPRVSAVWTADTRTSARLTVGTAYQPPPLQELVVPDPLPNVSGGYVAVGNPNLKPVQATEYDLGVERTFGASSATRLSADVYRSNLRAPVYYLIPPLEPRCGLTSVAGKEPCPLSYPVNAGDGVDRGLELALRQQLSNDTSVRASYAVHSSYLSSSPPAIQDGSLVEGQQTLGLPLHRAVVTLAGTPPRGFVYGASLAYEGAYNALNQPPYATLAARAGYRFNAGYELDIAGTNLTNVYDQRFTKTGSGVPYGGIAAPVGTDAYALQGTAFLMTLTRRF